MSGTATRLVIGATRLTRPNVAATKGAVSMVAAVDATRLRRTVPRQPPTLNQLQRRASAPDATSATIPTTESWYPMSSTARGSNSGAIEPTARTAHADVGR